MPRIKSVPQYNASAAEPKRSQDALWLSQRPSKRWAEIFFLKYSIYWISIMAVVVVTKVYASFGDVEFFALSVLLVGPAVLYPLFFPGHVINSSVIAKVLSNISQADRTIPITQRYWFKANIWIAIFSYVGNYFWTHYFYKVLHAYYTFPVKFQLNEVPFFLYLITHAYFISYHTATSVILRRYWSSKTYASFPRVVQIFANVLVVFSLSYVTSLMEAVTISSVPYYVIDDRRMFYLIGSAFYGIYFYVSFPMYARMDEKLGSDWGVGRVAVDSLGASMLVTIVLDLWRLALGPLAGNPIVEKITSGLPWLSNL